MPGGWFAGSTSQLELYHSLSLWNYTPVGMVALIEAADCALSSCDRGSTA